MGSQQVQGSGFESETYGKLFVLFVFDSNDSENFLSVAQMVSTIYVRETCEGEIVEHAPNMHVKAAISGNLIPRPGVTLVSLMSRSAGQG